MNIAVDQCLSVAAHHFDSKLQKQLLKVYNFLRLFLNHHQSLINDLLTLGKTKNLFFKI